MNRDSLEGGLETDLPSSSKRIGFALEGLLAPSMAAHFRTWKKRSSVDVSSYLEPKCLRDESFWAMIPPVKDILDIGSELAWMEAEVFIFTERPEKLHLVTRSWLKRHNLLVADDAIVYGSIGTLKRYDCRLYGLDYYFDSDRVLNTFVYDKTVPVGIGKGFEDWIQSYPTLYDAVTQFEREDKREFVWTGF